MRNIIVEEFMKSCTYVCCSIVCQKREASSTTSSKLQMMTKIAKNTPVNPDPPEIQLR